MVAALPRDVKLVGIGKLTLQAESEEQEVGRFATADEVEELCCQFKYIRGTDAEIWKNEMECMSQPPASPTSGFEDAHVAGSDEWAMVS